MSAQLFPLTDGRFCVPGNGWHALDGRPGRMASIAVVVPFYDQQADLDRLLAALDLQDYPVELIDVVVADDGSPVPPDTSSSSLRCSVVRQPDRGFRAAAARNLGAAAANGEVLCFLDADTLPEPGYLREITRLPSLLPDALVVGRRRHADLDGWPAADVARWWAGERCPVVLDEPRWLADAYVRTGDLATVDHTAYRYVISSVMCCSRELFDYCGGFDESFGQYGGEDWEFAHRAAVCGAVFHHARRAVAWHNGPDWGGREVADRAAAKNTEALALARLITDPDARTHGLHYEIPEVAVELDADGHGLGSLVATLAGLLTHDVGIWITGADAESLYARAQLQDGRVHVGPVPQGIRRRARFLVTVTGRAVLAPRGVAELVDVCTRPGVTEVRVSGAAAEVVCRASWAVHRQARWQIRDAFGVVEQVDGEVVGMTVVDAELDLSW
ncbi:glycosyltransferase [Mycolicibacterium sp. 018/SC-01/001]|uniref:glycosyltransferase n=1 Tax=Mycolicibacterium sp. 018/SC-01/001 TaxID=2592069 RepID=UPI00117D07D5|nr:glycosyltransferase [Mycolicibacterium sp. 018/SC-01/001]TRW82798.1 glycosyltransferase [Mycolicibacterium sp. 018/SC-01/001]